MSNNDQPEYATEYRTAGIIVGVLFVVVALVFGIVGVTVGRRRKCNWLLGCVFFALAGIIEAIGLWYRSTLKEGSSGCYDSCATYPQFFVWWLLLIPALAFLITGIVVCCRTETTFVQTDAHQHVRMVEMGGDHPGSSASGGSRVVP